MASGLFIFIGPAPVVGERFPGKEVWIGRRRLAGEQHHHLAAHVDALIVVPFIFRRDNSVADEYGRRIELRIRALLISDADEVVEPFQRGRWTGIGSEGKFRVRLRIDAHQLEFLKIRALVAGRFQPQ